MFEFGSRAANTERFADSGTLDGIAWTVIDALWYGGVASDELVFDLGMEGRAEAVESAALSMRLERAVQSVAGRMVARLWSWCARWAERAFFSAAMGTLGILRSNKSLVGK